MTGHDDIPAALGDSFRKGTIVSVDGAKAVVKCGEIVSPPLPWLVPAGAFVVWLAPTVGQQVCVLCPEGDIEGGVILNGLYSDSFPAPAEGLKLAIHMPDGTALTYDAEAHTLTLALTGGGKVLATASGGFEFNGESKFVGNMTVTGDQHVSGTVTADTDVVGGGKSLKGHKHTGVTAGTAQTGAPA